MSILMYPGVDLGMIEGMKRKEKDERDFANYDEDYIRYAYEQISHTLHSNVKRDEIYTHPFLHKIQSTASSNANFWWFIVDPQLKIAVPLGENGINHKAPFVFNEFLNLDFITNIFDTYHYLLGKPGEGIPFESVLSSDVLYTYMIDR